MDFFVKFNQSLKSILRKKWNPDTTFLMDRGISRLRADLGEFKALRELALNRLRIHEAELRCLMEMAHVSEQNYRRSAPMKFYFAQKTETGSLVFQFRARAAEQRQIIEKPRVIITDLRRGCRELRAWWIGLGRQAPPKENPPSRELVSARFRGREGP
jgi:hypothetical protein